MKEIGTETFYGCANLKSVTILPGSQLEKLGKSCFCKSGIEILTLPGTVKEVGRDAFSDCNSLKTIWLEGDHEIDLSRSGMPDSAQVIFLSVTLPEGVRLRDLCMVKEAIIPDGVERIGACWFFGSGVESVKIPASVKKIGPNAFYGCRSLKSIVFAKGSQLKKIGPGSFCRTEVEETVVPKETEKLNSNIFR